MGGLNDPPRDIKDTRSLVRDTKDALSLVRDTKDALSLVRDTKDTFLSLVVGTNREEDIDLAREDEAKDIGLW